MWRLAALVAVSMLVSPAVRASGLEPGGLALRLLDSPDIRRFDVSPLAALSFGPVVGESFQPFGDRLAVGGFVRMNFASWSVGAAISRFDERPGAELEIGLEDGETEYLLRLGADWSGESSMDAAEASVDDGIDLSLTINHALSPDVFVGGMAGAGRDRTSGDEPGRFRFGAGLGLRF